MPGCSVNDCNSRDGGKFKLLRVSRVQEKKNEWVKYLITSGRNWPVSNSFFICERHFEFELDKNGHYVRHPHPTVPKEIWLNIVSFFNLF